MTTLTAEDLIVLLVEDHPSMRKIIKAMLLQAHVRAVLEAADGIEAMEILREKNKHHPKSLTETEQTLVVEPMVNLIVCDWMMPKMSGIELLRIVRGDQRWQDIPFIMLTAETEREKVLTALEKGVTDYIAKPFTPSLLEAKILQLLKFINAS